MHRTESLRFTSMLTAQNRVTTLYKYVKHQSLIPIIQQLGVDVLL